MKTFLKLLLPLFVLSSCGVVTPKDSASDSLMSSLLSSSSETNDFDDFDTIVGDKKEEFQRLANECEYDFDPTAITIKERKNSSGKDLNLSEIDELTKNIVGHDEKRMSSNGQEIHKVHYLYGTLAKDDSIGLYSNIDVDLSLWEDGLVFGSIAIRGKENSDKSFGGIWWNEAEDVVIRCSVSEKIVEVRRTDIVKYEGYKFGVPHGPNVILKRTYYYPTIGFVMYDPDVGHEISATPIADFLDAPYFSTYEVDKKLNLHYINSRSAHYQEVNIPDLRYPHQDQAKAICKGQEITFDVNVIPAEGLYSIDGTATLTKSYSLYDHGFLSDIKLLKNGIDTGYVAADLRTLLNKETKVLSVYLPDGRIETINLDFNFESESNKAIGEFGGAQFEFTFKSFDKLEIKTQDTQLVANIQQYDLPGENGYFLTIVDEPQNDDSLLNILPKEIYGFYMTSGSYRLIKSAYGNDFILRRNYI